MSDEFLPFGRLIPCELVITVDSSRIATPIVGLVTEDQWENGNLIIPAGSEVHGQCQLDRSRDRIASERNWVMVWQESGKELPVQGVALDSSPRPDGSGWEITDGSAGLRGMTLKGDQYAEIKEIIAKAISAGAEGFVPTVTSIGPLGSVSSTTTGSWQTALAQTVQAAGQVYGNQVLQSIKDDGVYIRVPAGKQFYLYVTQTIDLSKSTRGGSKITSTQEAALNEKQILFVSLVALLPACAIVQRHKPKADVVRVKPIKTAGTTVPQSEYDTVRNGEVIKQYYAGAYVDPNNPNVRHNPHDIQRLEQAATWNLRPNVPVVAGGPAYVASSSASQNGAISAQLSGALDRQKGYTDALTQQNEKLQDIIQQLNAAKEQDAQARAATEAELKMTLETLKSLKEEIQKQPQQPPTRPFPSFTPPKSKSLFDSLKGNEQQPPSNSKLSPRAKDLLDLVDMHVAALENKKGNEHPEDTIDLDEVSAPLTKVAQAKK